MRLESVRTIYHDGGHNAFTGLVRWRDRFWVCFRRAAEHRALDGSIAVISSPDLETWSAPATPISTDADNRDPKLFVWRDRLFVTSLTIRRTFADPKTHSGPISTHAFFTLVSHTDDGVHWSEPVVVWEPWQSLWWVEPHGERLYATGYESRPVDEAGRLCPGSAATRRDSTALAVSEDGLDWRTHAIISRERQPSECALTFLPDGRAVGFLRHDDESAPFPEIVVAAPLYERWDKLLDFPFMTNGPCLGLVGGTVVAAGRAFVDWGPAEIAALAPPGTIRGLLVMTLDLDTPRVVPELIIPCAPVPEGDFPDVSYAAILDLGGGRFAMSYYDGLKTGYSDIKLARLRL